MPEPKPMKPEPNPRAVPDEAHAAERKPRRRFTPEERIANRKAEIARIEEQERQRLIDRIDGAGAILRDCARAAESGGMTREAKLCADALAVLAGTKKVEAG